MFRRNARSVILHAKLRAVRYRLPADGDMGSRWRMVHRVIHQVGHRATQLFFIPQHFQLVIHLKAKSVLLLTERLRLAFDHAQYHRHIDLFIEQKRRCGFNFRQREQLFYQSFHARGLVAHR